MNLDKLNRLIDLWPFHGIAIEFDSNDHYENKNNWVWHEAKFKYRYEVDLVNHKTIAGYYVEVKKQPLWFMGTRNTEKYSDHVVGEEDEVIKNLFKYGIFNEGDNTHFPPHMIASATCTGLESIESSFWYRGEEIK